MCKWDLGYCDDMRLLFSVIYLLFVAETASEGKSVQSLQLVFGGKEKSLVSLALGATRSKRFTKGEEVRVNAFTSTLSSRSFTQKAKKMVYLGVIYPHTTFTSRTRLYQKRLNSALEDLKKSKSPQFNFTKTMNISRHEVIPTRGNPSPTDILNALCTTFLPQNVSAILYLNNNEVYGSNIASEQYFLQLASYLGIPVISWNADNSGLEQKVSKSITLQLAPSIGHQSAAILSILARYDWRKFSIVTSHIAGHNDFVQAINDRMAVAHDLRFTLIATVRVNFHNQELLEEQMEELMNTDTRIILLYATREEAGAILKAALGMGLTGRDFMWLVTQSVIGKISDVAPEKFPPGMLGVHFDTKSDDSLTNEIDKAVKVFGHGLELFVNDPGNAHISLQPNLSCTGQGDSRWPKGEHFLRYLRNVSVNIGGGKPNIQFNPDGTLKYAELDIMNLNENFKWEKIGTWTPDGLEIKDIVWPGNSHVPPQGVPEKFHVKVTFMEEPPFIHLDPPDPVTDKCINRGVQCRVDNGTEIIGVNMSRSIPHFQCCSGFCIDLLEMFAKDLGFTYDLVRVEDGFWGAEVNGKWNGLVSALVNHKTDMVMTSFTISSQREEVIDFSIPFMETGIGIVVAKRTGIISPKAFLEPFDTFSWVIILVISIQVAAFAIFLFEWLSPAGYNMRIQPPRGKHEVIALPPTISSDTNEIENIFHNMSVCALVIYISQRIDHKFSLFRTYWLVWAILFGAAVNVDCPRSYTARFMSSVWAMFAVVFLAIYTASLATVMITREEYHDLTGIDDPRLAYPAKMQPPFRYGSIGFGNTEAVLAKNHERIYKYMKQFNKNTVAEGIRAVRKGELDAFIYDSSVLDYLVGQDDECRILTVGTWYAITGYGVAFPRNSKHVNSFNEKLLMYRENGDLDRLYRYWMSGTCKPEKQERSSSKPLSVEQFMSAFILLGLGIVLAVLLLFMEHIYFRYLRNQLARTDRGGCCALVSMSMGQSLSFRGAVFEAQDVIRRHRCRNQMCDSHLMNVRNELELAQYRIRHLEKELHTIARHTKPVDNKHHAFWKGGFYKPRDLTRNHVASTEISSLMNTSYNNFSSHRYTFDPRTEIAELETVL